MNIFSDDNDKKVAYPRIFILLICIAVVVLPFNNLPYNRHILHEMANEAPFYPITIGFFLWFIFIAYKRTLFLPNDKFLLLLYLLFIVWTFIASAFNAESISNVTFKGRSGTLKFFFQMGLLLYMYLIPVFIYNVFRNNAKATFRYIRTTVLVSFFIVGFYSFFETLFLFGFIKQNILSIIEPLIHDYSGNYHRLRSVSGEPSYFAMYSAFAFPFLLSNIFDKKKKFTWLFYILIGYFYLLTLLTYSRSAYLIIALESFLFFMLVFIVGNKNMRVYTIKSILILCFVLVLEVSILSFAKTSEYSFAKTIQVPSIQVPSPFIDSNVIRYASQSAALMMAIHNPVFGLGMGQYGFYYPEFVPGWAENAQNREAWTVIKRFASDDPSTEWPPTYSLLMRIVAELGFVGVVLWLGIWGVIIIRIYKKLTINMKVNDEFDLFGVSLLVATLGMFLVMLIHGSFRYFGYWIILGLVLVYIEYNIEK